MHNDNGFSVSGNEIRYSDPDLTIEDGIERLRPIALYGDLVARVLLNEIEKQQRWGASMGALLALNYDVEYKVKIITNKEEELDRARKEAAEDLDRIEENNKPLDYIETLLTLDESLTKIEAILSRNK